MGKKLNQSGAIFLLSLIVLTVVLVGTVALVTSSFTYKQNSRYSLDKLGSTNLAEAGIDKAVASLNKSSGSYNGETETTVGAGTYEVKVTSVDANNKIIESTGYVPNKANAKSKQTVKIQVSKGDGLSFAYGLQAGDGGFVMDGGSRINGSVFSNGDISISGGATITGDAYVGGGTQAVADQQTDCANPNCADFIFGKTVSANNQLDVAQSFRPSQTKVINKVSLKLKKFGNPANATVRILSDNSNKPNKNGLITSGTLAANLVTSSYGFIDIGLSPAATLTAGTLYWIVIDTSSDSSNYWAWSQDTLGSYSQGSAAWSPNWQQNPNPTWNSITGDLGFQTYMGGVITKIAGVGSSTINGSAYANTLTADNSSALQIGQNAYYQTQSQITVHGSNCTNNTFCHPNSPDPQPNPLPISQSNIDEWKDQADDSVLTGDVILQWPCTTVLSKRKYVGNVTIQGGCTIDAESPVWITGNLTVQGGSTLRLKSSYGGTSGVIVVDGVATLTGGSKVQGSGTTGSYLTVISTYNSPTVPAINVNGGNSTSIVYAGDGIVQLSGGANLREVTGKKVVLTTGAIVTYESGVANPFFTSGPTGSFNVVKGTYQLK